MGLLFVRRIQIVISFALSSWCARDSGIEATVRRLDESKDLKEELNNKEVFKEEQEQTMKAENTALKKTNEKYNALTVKIAKMKKSLVLL